MRLTPALAALVTLGCLDIPARVPRDAIPDPEDAGRDAARPDAARPDAARVDAGKDAFVPPPPAVVAIEARSLTGEARALDDLTRAFVIEVRCSAAMTGEPEPFVLLAGPPGADLVEDLEAAPLRTTTLARVIDAEVRREADRVWVTPRAPLGPGDTVTLAVGGWARDALGTRLTAPRAFELRVSSDHAAGAAAREAWPADGAGGVGTELPFVAIRFDGQVRNLARGVEIVSEPSRSVPFRFTTFPCSDLGWQEGQCVRLEPSGALSPSTRYFVRTTPELLDATGAEVPAWSSSFVTGTGPDRAPPELVPIATCAVDELPSDGACVRADDRSITVRFVASEPVRGQVAVEPVDAAPGFALIAPRGGGEIVLSELEPESALLLSLELIDTAGLRASFLFLVETTEALPLLSITEVRADPFGAEPRQELVEIANLGATEIDLAGFAIGDSLDDLGDVIAGPARVPPGTRVLVVSSDFDPDDRGPDQRDAAIPPGVPLVRVDRSIGTSGLSSAGEPVFLRDAQRRRISAAPAMPAREGVCIVRVIADPRSGAPGSFDYDPGQSCSPGR